MSASFEAPSLASRYEFVRDCPDGFLGPLLRLSHGTLRQRIEGLRRWREALLEGTIPASSDWPPAALEGPARKSIQAMGLARFCKDQPELVDQLLGDIISSWERFGAQFQSEVLRELTSLAELTRLRLDQAKKESARGEQRKPRQIQLDEKTLANLRAKAEADVSARVGTADENVTAKWEAKVRVWSEIADVFGDLGNLMGRGWDMTQGILKQVGWNDLLKLRALIEKLPELREIIRALGRFTDARNGESVSEQVFLPVRRIEQELREIKVPGIPPEVNGAERSGELSRMLPSEAVLLGHPKLRLLWHARRAERALLTYKVEGTDWETVLVEGEATEAIEQKKPRPERGPIIAIIDTSGSMHGLPERVAKAVVLEALRTAHSEKRDCYLYAYSGPGQVVEHELRLSAEGLGNLMQFLGMSFGGGNDEVGVISKALAQLRQRNWLKADVVIVSDGEWPTPQAVLQSVSAAKGTGTRFHGIQIGNRGKTGLHSVCDPVHVFADWARVGGWGATPNHF